MKTTLLTFGGILIVVFALLFGLKALNKPKGEPNPQTPAAPSSIAGYPIPPIDYLNNLFNETDYIDYIFQETNFSLSVEEPESVKGNVRYLSVDPVTDYGCAPFVGNIYFNKEGRAFAEGEIYYKDDCAFFILLDANRQRQYACAMSASGKKGLKRFLTGFQTQPAQ
ncbi:MAG: hypothetical protein AAF598_19530 [Bacteroidota bacterium]